MRIGSSGRAPGAAIYDFRRVKSSSDPELVGRCLEGDEAAWHALAARYADVVYGVAWRSGLRSVDAADVVQEVFLALWKGLPRIRRRDRLLAWILKTARRESWRRAKQLRAMAERDKKAARSELADGPLPVAQIERVEREQLVRQAFGALGERCRRLLDALFFEADTRSYQDIASSLGMRVGSIGPTRRRCLAGLEEALVSLGFGPPHVSGEGGAASRGPERKRK